MNPSTSSATTRVPGIDTPAWERAVATARQWCDQDKLPAMSFALGVRGQVAGPVFLGRQKLARDSAPLGKDAIFLIASLTKPIVAMGALWLVEQGKLALSDRVGDYLPEFRVAGKFGMTIRHLLTHTSGLPDMLPDNLALRAANAPLERFSTGAGAAELAFSPGRGTQYQSMGFAALGEIIKKVDGRSASQLLRDEIFAPLGMLDTALGAPPSWLPAKLARVPEIRVPAEHAEGTNWNWNSRYWLTLGAPWGGLLTTPDDLIKYSQMLLGHGQRGTTRVLGPATVAAATSNQLRGMRDLPPEERDFRPWGFGWRLNWPANSVSFGDLLGPRTYGHFGATGTLWWLDPDREAFAIIFTTEPQDPPGSYLVRLSNMLAAAVER